MNKAAPRHGRDGGRPFGAERYGCRPAPSPAHAHPCSCASPGDFLAQTPYPHRPALGRGRGRRRRRRRAADHLRAGGDAVAAAHRRARRRLGPRSRAGASARHRQRHHHRLQRRLRRPPGDEQARSSPQGSRSAPTSSSTASSAENAGEPGNARPATATHRAHPSPGWAQCVMQPCAEFPPLTRRGDDGAVRGRSFGRVRPPPLGVTDRREPRSTCPPRARRGPA